jgi:hypothetical protein
MKHAQLYNDVNVDMEALADYLIEEGNEEEDTYLISDWTIHIIEYLNEKHQLEDKLDVIIEMKTGKPVEVV